MVSIFLRGTLQYMELLRSVVVDQVPSLTELVRFGLVETLRAVKSLLLLYPLNILIFFLTVYVAVRRMSFFFVKGKKQFRAVYDPFPHHESPLQDLKLMKKDVREVQAQLIALLKGGEINQEGINAVLSEYKQEEGSAEMGAFLSEVRQKSGILLQVESELKQAASQAFAQISKMNQI